MIERIKNKIIFQKKILFYIFKFLFLKIKYIYFVGSQYLNYFMINFYIYIYSYIFILLSIVEYNPNNCNFIIKIFKIKD
jgi:hypothetical protein